MIGNNDIGQTRSEFWLQKLYSKIISNAGVAFYGEITTATSASRFKVDSMQGLGINLLNNAYFCQIIQAGAAAPEGEIHKISAYDSGDGDITVNMAFSVSPAIGDCIIVIHESLAKQFLIADGSITYPESVVDNSIFAHIMAVNGDISDYDNATMSLEALNIDLDTIIANQVGDETISSYNLPNDTAENTLLVITNTKRLRLDAMWLDFTNLVQDITIKVYHKIDGSTYRQYDSFSWGTSEEDGILLSQVTINGDWKMTITSTIAQGGVKEIPYNVIKTTIEA